MLQDVNVLLTLKTSQGDLMVALETFLNKDKETLRFAFKGNSEFIYGLKKAQVLALAKDLEEAASRLEGEVE